MPIIKTDTVQQHDLGTFHYGEMPIEGMPTLEAGKNFAYFDGTQWHEATLIGAGLVEVNWDADNGVLEIYAGTNREAGSFTADATLA